MGLQFYSSARVDFQMRKRCGGRAEPRRQRLVQKGPHLQLNGVPGAVKACNQRTKDDKFEPNFVFAEAKEHLQPLVDWRVDQGKTRVDY